MPHMADDLGEEELRLSTWEASDLKTDHMEMHCGRILRQVCVEIRERDVFQLYQDAALTMVPSVVIIACISPFGVSWTFR